MQTGSVSGLFGLEHLLDQVDAPARAIQFGSEQLVGRAGCGAETAMHAAAQDAIGFRDIGIAQQVGGNGSLHL